MNIRILRLITGEDLLCEQVSVTDAVVTIKNPVRIVVMPSKADPHTPSIGLAPWCEFAADKTMILQKEHILFNVEPINEFKNQYQGMFGGILTPPNKLILPE